MYYRKIYGWNLLKPTIIRQSTAIPVFVLLCCPYGSVFFIQLKMACRISFDIIIKPFSLYLLPLFFVFPFIIKQNRQFLTVLQEISKMLYDISILKPHRKLIFSPYLCLPEFSLWFAEACFCIDYPDSRLAFGYSLSLCVAWPQLVLLSLRNFCFLITGYT